MKIAFVITGLSTGGAEMMLLKLLERIDRSRFSCHVFSLTGVGAIGEKILELGIPVIGMGMKTRMPNPLVITKLGKHFREGQVDLVHTWMYHADLIGGIAARVSNVATVVWGIRNTNIDRDKTKLSTRLVVMLNAFVSKIVPTGILSCSEVARDVHVARGYAAMKMVVIPNGFDLSRFKPDKSARDSVRAELRLPTTTPLVGIVGRFDRLKNHLGFIEAAGLLRQTQPDVHVVMVGKGLDADNESLVLAARSAGVTDTIHLLGQRDDIPRLMASFDVLASSSFGEAFPNVIGEAMACGVPCAVTDVGDCAHIVADTGRIVEPGDMEGLARALETLLTRSIEDRLELGRRARARIEENFEIGEVVRRYERYYEHLVLNYV